MARGVTRWKPAVAGGVRPRGSADVEERRRETDIYGAPIGAMEGSVGGARDQYIQQNLGRFSPQAEADLIYRTTAGQRTGGFADTSGMSTNAMLAALLGMGSGSGKGVSASDRLALRKYEDERKDLQRQREALAGYLSSGAYRGGSDAINQAIMDMAAQQRGDVEAATGRALANIAAGYEQAQAMTGEGFNALQQYLQQNPNDPYAQLVAASGVAPQAEGANILSAYGVGAEPVLAQVAAEAAASQQGAAGFQNLLNTLSAAAQQADVSRLAEARMAGRVAGAGLESQRAGYRTQAEQAQAAALAQIAQRQAEAQLQEQIRLENLRIELERALAAAGVRPPVATTTRAPVEIPLSGQFGLVD